MGNMIISDEELYTLAEEMNMFGTNISEMQEALGILLTSISEAVFQEGNIATNIKYLCEQIASLKDDVDFLVKEQNTNINNLIVDIDEADVDIY